LKVAGVPCIYLEAKGISENLDDKKFIAQLTEPSSEKVKLLRSISREAVEDGGGWTVRVTDSRATHQRAEPGLGVRVVLPLPGCQGVVLVGRHPDRYPPLDRAAHSGTAAPAVGVAATLSVAGVMDSLQQ